MIPLYRPVEHVLETCPSLLGQAGADCLSWLVCACSCSDLPACGMLFGERLSAQARAGLCARSSSSPL
jgi:hypothetical protein